MTEPRTYDPRSTAEWETLAARSLADSQARRNARRRRRYRLGLVLLLLAILAIAAASAFAAAGAQAATCHVSRWHHLPGPDNAWDCTPGAFASLTRAEACKSKDRPTLHAADRREVLREYGVPGWSGADGELDHRVPFFLGGLTTPANIWPERGPIPNAKDRLEALGKGSVYDRVCRGRPHWMRVRTARRIFLGDWRVTYRAWKADGWL